MEGKYISTGAVSYTHLDVYKRQTLYRGVNALEEYRVLERDGKRAVVLLNNVSSFTHSRERADEFGDYIIEAQVPLVKVLAYYNLLPKLLRGEGEFLVIGGVYEVSINA